MVFLRLSVMSLTCAALAMAQACIVDTDKPCDHGRVELVGPITGCICAPGHVPAPDNASCVSCDGEHEEARNGVCACVSGYSRMGKTCVPTPDAGGDSSQEDAKVQEVTGQDHACMSQEECAGFDADFCLPFPNARTCAVRNCASGMQKCSGDRVCCDVSGANAIFPDLSMADGVCVTQAACAMGGKVVTP
jgi:hypothetical protein